VLDWLITERNELLQWPVVRCLSVWRRWTLLLPGKWLFSRQTLIQWSPGASPLHCVRSQMSKVTRFSHFYVSRNIDTSRKQMTSSEPVSYKEISDLFFLRQTKTARSIFENNVGIWTTRIRRRMHHTNPYTLHTLGGTRKSDISWTPRIWHLAGWEITSTLVSQTWRHYVIGRNE